MSISEMIKFSNKTWKFSKLFYTPLILASQNGHAEIVETILDQKEFDFSKDKFDQLALILASKNAHTETVKLLLKQKGIDVNAQDFDLLFFNIFFYYLIIQNNTLHYIKLFNTALILASSNGHTEIVKLLLAQEGIDINVKNKILITTS